jgi:hypothetical protein
MGWVFKGFLAVVAFILVGAGVWWLGAIIFGYLLFSSRGGRRKAKQVVVVAQPFDSGDGVPTRELGRRGGRPGFQWRWRYLLGALFLVTSLIALGAHGTCSPLVFGGLGATCFLWGPASRTGHIPSVGFSPVAESTMLRSRVLPFEWLTVLEIKLSSQESARALSVLHDTMMVVASPSEKASAYLVVKQAALTYRSAEARMSERLRELAGLLSRRGAYLLPLDSSEVSRKFQYELEALKLDAERDGVTAAVGHSPYDVLVVKPDGLHVKSLGAYIVRRADGESEIERVIAGRPEQPVGAERPSSVRSATLPSARESFEKQPLLWEVVSSLQERFQLSEPDGYVMFLNSLHLTRGAPPGAKLTVGQSNGSSLTVESLGGTPVELTRGQLRTVVRIYG